VVTAVGEDELEDEEPDDDDEDEPDDDEDEDFVLFVDDDEVVVGDAVLAVVEVVVPPEAVVVVVLARAGSWPETICAAITPHTARNAVTVTAVMRRRIERIRRRRASRRARPSSRGVKVWVSGGGVMSSSFDAGPSPRVCTG
jgi:hypothetical protein